MKPGDHDVLDANLARLFAASWHPVAPRAEFASALRARLESELLLARRDTASKHAAGITMAEIDPAPEIPIHTHRREQADPPTIRARGAMSQRVRLAAAVLALLAGLSAAWMLLRGHGLTLSLDELLARGSVAVQDAIDADWRAVTEDELARGIAIAEQVATVVTPAARAVVVRLEPVRAGDAGRIEVGPATQVALGTPREDGARDLVLSGTSARILRDAAESTRAPDASAPRRDPAAWRLLTPDGVVALAHGDVTWSRTSEGPGGAASTVELGAGRAWIEGEPRTDLVVGRRVRLAHGAVVLTGALEDPDADGTDAHAVRTQVDTAESAAPVAPLPPSTAPAADPKRATLVARIVAPAGQRLPAEVRVSLLRRVRLPEVADPKSTTFTNSAGTSFRGTIANLRPGTYDVFVEAAGFAVARKLGVELTAGIAQDVDVELAPSREARGFVREAESGAPIAGAIVLAEALIPAQVIPFHPSMSADWRAATTTRADGSFTLNGLDAATADLRVSAPGYAAVWVNQVRTFESDATVASPADDPIELHRGGSVEGRIARPDGTSWAAARVIASRMGTGLFGERMSFGQVASTSDGAYRIDDLPPGDYVVLAFDPTAFGLPATRNFRVEGSEVVHIDVGPTDRRTRLVGTVRDARGEPLPDMDIMIGHQDTGFAQSTRWISERTDSAGHFAFEGVDPRRYMVFVGRGLGASFTVVDEIDVPLAPEVRHDVTLAAGSMRGRVLSIDGGPAAGVWLIATALDAAETFVGRAQTDGAGMFEMLGLAPGNYTVAAHTEQPGSGAVRRAPIVIALEPVDVTLRFVRGVELRVRVVDADGEPAPGRTLRFTDADGVAWQFTMDGRTDEHGIQSIPGIAPGRWKIAVDGARELEIDLELGPRREVELRLEKHAGAQPADGPDSDH